MLPASPSALLALVLLQGSGEPPLDTPCEEVERVELSLAPSEVAQEVCVSPGLMTGFLFDVPASVELQDEVRFAEVMRGRHGMSLVPPKDMAPGERLRLTAHLTGGPAQQSFTFTLVAHPGDATHQVEVYHDQRPRESLRREVAEERAKNQQLLKENRRLQSALALSGGLRSLFLSGALRDRGIPAQYLRLGLDEQHSDDAFSFKRVVTYRSENSVGVEVLLVNSGAAPWSAEGASLVSATGEKLEGVSVGQSEPIPPQQSRQVFIEANAAREFARGDWTLRLLGTDDRGISISKVTFP